MAEMMDDRENAPSPDSKCSICLSRISNKSFTDRCFHMFCFGCLVEWSKRNAVCPLCKQSFTKIFHNIQSLSKYDIYDVLSHPSYLPSLSSVNIVSSINRLAMAGHVSPFGTPFSNENEFVITISPDSSFNDSQVMSRSNLFSARQNLFGAPPSQLNTLSQTYIVTHNELVQLRIHLLFYQNVETMRTWLRNELQKISRLVARLNTSYIPRSIERIISEMKRESHTCSTFFSAVSFYIGSEYTKMFLVRLKSYLGTIHDTNNNHHDNLESIIESASINTLLNNSPFQENSNSSLGSLVVDSDVEITNEDISGGNFVANHRHKSTTTSNDHFISGLIKPENSSSHQPCSFSLVVSIPRSNNGDTTTDAPSSSTKQNNNSGDFDIDIEKVDEKHHNISKNPIFLSSDDDDEVIDLVRPDEKAQVHSTIRRVSGKKRVYALTSDDDEDDDDLALEKNERATTSRCKVRKMRKKRLKKTHSPQPSNSIVERNVFHITSKNKISTREEVKGRRKFKKHHSGHKNSLRRVQEVFHIAKTEECDGSVKVCMGDDEGGNCDEKEINDGHLLAFEKLFPDKTPSQIVKKHDTSREDASNKMDLSSALVACSSIIDDDISHGSSLSNNTTSLSSGILKDGVAGLSGNLEENKEMSDDNECTQSYDKDLEDSVNEVRISQGGDEVKSESPKDDIENTPLDFSLKNFDFKLNLSPDTNSREAKNEIAIENIAIENKNALDNSLNEEEDYCVIEKEVDTISLHSEDSIQMVYHNNKDRDDDDEAEDDGMVEGGADDDIQEILF